MIININQKKISWNDSYAIFEGEEQIFEAESKLMRILSEIEMRVYGSARMAFLIKRKWGWTPKYDLFDSNGTAYELTTVSFWKGHYSITYKNDVYDLYRHRGRKASIYKNGRQIAWWDKKAVSWFKGDNYTITANANCDKAFVSALCLVVDNFSSSKDRGGVNIDPGHIGPQAKEFDVNWKPRED
ncbi:MAG: hypothetical protein GC181_00065 [Bacteroidetes bacterium]|nr:hypothetical protein [Bacteroidota bacterium]